jgi:glycosyltransferase involved in cell wall biosynthesis
MRQSAPSQQASRDDRQTISETESACTSPDTRPQIDESQEAARSVESSLTQLDQGLELLEQIDQQPGDTGGAADVSPWPTDFKLSIVIPVYNEQATVEIVIDRVRALDVPKEVVIVDDCSTDGTQYILERFEKEPDFHIIFSPTNRGKGAALRAGFAQAAGDIIIVQDADLEYDPQDIPGLLQPILRDEADVVYGSRFLGERKSHQSRLHRIGNRLLTWASNRTTGLKLTDMETCYKAFRREAIRGVRLEQDRFGFEPEVTAKLARRGFRFTETPIGYDARGYDEGKKIGLRDLFNALYCIWRYGHQE